MARASLSQFAYKLIGARTSPSLFTNLDPFVGGGTHDNPKASLSNNNNFGQSYGLSHFLNEVARHKLVFCGEIHSIPSIVSLQTEIAKKMTKEASSSSSHLHVVLEHFSFEMQTLLEDYQRGHLDFDEMVEEYKRIGTENHNLTPYLPLLEHARENEDVIRLHAGFLPRTYARMLMKEGDEAALKAVPPNWLPPDFTAKTLAEEAESDFHYNLFESLIVNGNSAALHYINRIVDGNNAQKENRFRGIFKAQILKDAAMAHKVNRLIADYANDCDCKHKNENDEKKEEEVDDRFLIIAGNGHLMHYQGVPERVLRANPTLIDQSCLLIAHACSDLIHLSNEKAVIQDIENNFGPRGSNPADFVFVFKQDHNDGNEDKAAKQETAKAYDKVGETAHIEGNLKKAKAIMANLGYTDEEFAIAGTDAYNYQGVGNPHLHAKIQPGETVLDVGSGLGVDSFIAAHYAKVRRCDGSSTDNSDGGNNSGSGKVIGIDISQKEVNHAQARAVDRGEDIRFSLADMENIPLPDNCIDVVISNGAFCLAPNKRKAFSEIFRVLKPGGRMSICTSTLKGKDLEPGVNWPLCMRMFIPQQDILPLCEGMGFEGVSVDDSDSLMTYELPKEEEEDILGETNPERNKVHSVGNKEFEHLENYDMNQICARVCVVARKPVEE
mmetsp:Transcript_15697/g.23082  ORF Transcript_15697/g.23082 Transcript_15697/m.23082 type:complete len:667 (+) Transcript_15697:90-2090(+)|eukprot:CAMPEP_0195510848 /NCGR_PEP_ID=MMETSP0794_2-20130614/3370_1 /TAXON_ID=515487 /ORGANISM="Stephanopyxis turris, Strain CCMP 815" /LENGTH=666 /DNA_ID=CAMNT_0040638353 /DNA_START=89 /DNA_END=2089 /DNA_ORIENTATION=+